MFIFFYVLKIGIKKLQSYYFVAIHHASGLSVLYTKRLWLSQKLCCHEFLLQMLIPVGWYIYNMSLVKTCLLYEILHMQQKKVLLLNWLIGSLCICIQS